MGSTLLLMSTLFRLCGRVMCSDCSHFVRLAASTSSKKLRVCTSCHLGQQHEHYGSGSAMATPSASSHQFDRHTEFRVSRKQEYAPSTAAAGSSGIPLSALFNTTDDTWFTDPEPEVKDSRLAKSKNADDPPSRVATWTDAHSAGRRSVSDDTSRYHSQQSTTRQSQAAAAANTSRANVAMESDSDDAKYNEKKHFKSLFHSKAKTDKKQRKEEERKKSSDGEKQKQSAAVTYAASGTNGVAFPAAPIQPSFYEADVDALVVDDSPGYYDAIQGNQSSRQSKWQQDPVIVDHRSTALMPSAIAPREFSSGESYSIVERPADEGPLPAQPESTQRTSPANAPKTQESNVNGGIAGALKRFLGFSKSKAAAAPPPSAPKQSPPQSLPEVTLAQKSSESSAKATTTNISRIGSNRELKSDPSLQRNQSWNRYTMVDDAGSSRRFASQDSIHPLGSTVVGQSDATTLNWNHEDTQQPTFATPTIATATVSSTSRERSRTKSRSKKLKRRDTFDDLFESPKAVTRNNREPAASWGTVPSAQALASVSGSVGVSRFDQKRQEDEYRDDNSFDPLRSMTSPRNGTSSYYAGSGAEPSLSKASASSWGSVYSTPGAGTATYAVPVSLQRHTRDPRIDQSMDRAPDTEYVPEESAPRSNIMDEFAGGRTTKATKSADSVDDIFAQFERPSDYVFDERTGGYVQVRDISKSKRPSTAARKPQSDHRAQPAPVEQAYEPVYATYDQAVDKNRMSSVEAGDSEDDTIVDKISSLEGELAALKQLIRKRNGHGRSSTESKPKIKEISRMEVKPPRKESIFDHDSSDEEDKPKLSKTSSSKIGTSTRRTKGTQKKRRDSFADLFEDDTPADKKNIVGGKSYEALFQTGAKDEDEDEEEDLMHKKQKPQRQKSREYEQPAVLRNDLQDEDEDDFVSLKNRSTSSFRRAQSSAKRSSTTAAVLDPREANDDKASGYLEATRVHKPSSTALSEDGDTTTASKMVSAIEKSTSTKSKVKTNKNDDHIDALFDDSNDRDVTAFFRDEKEQDQPQSDDKQEKVRHKKRSGSRKSRSRNASLHSNTVDPFAVVEKEDSLFTSLDLAPLAPAVVAAIPFKVEPSADPDEEFSVNWKKIKSTRAKHTKRNSSIHDGILPSGTSLEEDIVQATIFDSAKLLQTEEMMNTTTLDIESSVGDISQREESTFSSSNSIETGSEDVASGVTPLTDELTTTTHEVHFATVEEVLHLETESKSSLAASLSDETPLPPLSTSRKNTLHIDEDPTLAILDSSKDLNLVSSFGVGLDVHGENESDGEHVHHDEEPSEDAISFEIKPKRRSSPSPTQPVFEPVRTPAPVENDNDEQVVMFGKYATQKLDRTGSNSTLLADRETPSTPQLDIKVDITTAPESSLDKVEESEFNADWQQMQEEAKARKKKLQMKQRQAQREKLSSAKKKKDKDGDQRLLTASSSSANLLDDDAGKSRKKKDKKSKHKSHRKLAVENGVDAPATASRSLTEL